jgi:hypothetical protein
MLIRFAVENFLPVSAEARLDLRCAATVPGALALPDGTHALGRALLIGGNATGKTALLKALGQLRSLVLAGTRPGQPLQLSPCRFLPAEQPTRFAITLLHDGALWTYELAATRELIESESLHRTVAAAPGEAQGHREVYFTRRQKSPLIPATTIQLGAAAAGERERLQLWAQATRGEQPFLCEALRRGSQLLLPPGLWLRERMQLVRAEAKIVGLAARCAREPAFARFVAELLQDAGAAVSEVGTTRARVDPDYFETPEEKQEVVAALTGYADGFVQTSDGEIIAEQDGRLVDLYMVRLRIRERGPAGGLVDVPVGELSDGLLRLLHLAPLLYGPGGSAAPPVYFIDEVDRSLHPRVVRRLLDRFAGGSPAAAVGPHGRVQLIATTHDAAQLDAVHRAEVRLVVRDPGTRIGALPEGLSGAEVAAGYLDGTLLPLPAEAAAG